MNEEAIECIVLVAMARLEGELRRCEVNQRPWIPRLYDDTPIER